jgi:hypothetical protein
MAKRKPARSRSKKPAARRPARAARSSSRRPATRSARKSGRGPARAAKPAASRTRTNRSSGKRSSAGATRTAKGSAKGSTRTAKSAPRTKPVTGREPIRTPIKKSTPKRADFGKRGAASHRLQIERDRRILEETVPGPPSSLDLDRHASAARTGREELREALAEHTETGPRLTGGDVDADWESAFSTGDEAPGGDMPTPDQDIVDEIGASIGVQYADDEELKSANKIEERDRKRWELDPASSDDYRDRTKRES